MKKHYGKYRHIEEFCGDYGEHFSRTLRYAPLSIFFQNRELRYTRVCNPLPGMGTGVVLGKKDAELFSPENASRLTEIKQRALDGDTLIKQEVTLVDNGKEFFYEVSVEPVMDGMGTITGIAGAMVDITERKQSEVRLEKLNTTFLSFGADPEENINRLVALCGQQLRGVCALYNRLDGGMLCSVGQWNTPPDFQAKDTPEGHICYDLIKDCSDSLKVIRDLPHTSYIETDSNVRKYGLQTYVGKPVSFGGENIGSLCVVYQDDHVPSDEEKGIMGVIAGAIGIEEKRKRAEEEIRLLNAELEKRVALRTAQLESANRELESFSYSVSHDLRSPLMILEGFIRELGDKYADRLDEPGRYYLDRIRNAVRRMGSLIEAILRLTSLACSEIIREKVNLGRAAEMVAAELRQTASERRVEFIIASDVIVEGDRRLLKIALENLLGNAFKYTGRKESATIEFGCAEKDGKTVCYVRDDGVGFDMDRIDRLFIPFQRLHDDEEYPGYGIGLATVKRIIDRHGGRIWAEGEPGKGATFYFTLS